MDIKEKIRPNPSDVDRETAVNLNLTAVSVWNSLRRQYPNLEGVRLVNLDPDFELAHPYFSAQIQPAGFTESPFPNRGYHAIALAHDLIKVLDAKKQRRDPELALIATALGKNIDEIDESAFSVYVVAHESKHMLQFLEYGKEKYAQMRTAEEWRMPFKGDPERLNAYRRRPTEREADLFALETLKKMYPVKQNKAA